MSYLSQLKKGNKIYTLIRNENKFDYQVRVYPSDVDDDRLCCSCVKYIDPNEVEKICPSVNSRMMTTFVYDECEKLLKAIEINDKILFIWNSSKLIHIQCNDEERLELCSRENMSYDLLRVIEKNDIFKIDNAISVLNGNENN